MIFNVGPAKRHRLGAPEQENNGLWEFSASLDNFTGEILPAQPGMTESLTLRNGQDRIQKKTTAPRPFGEVSIIRN